MQHFPAPLLYSLRQHSLRGVFRFRASFLLWFGRTLLGALLRDSRRRFDMEVVNAFIGKGRKPSPKEVATVLGPSAAAWSEFLHWMEEQGVTAREWKSDGAKYGWALRLKRKDRNIAYLSPCSGCFRVGFILGDRAMEAVRHTEFSAEVARLIAASPHYAEGTGIRLVVHKSGELAPIRTLASIKLAS
jgi:Protein of unknown function (DUF3788)